MKSRFLRTFNEVFVTWFYLGKMPKAPGTFGTIGAIPLVMLLFNYNIWIYLSVVVVLAILGIIGCQIYETQNNSHASSELVIDEVVGYCITMATIPNSWQTFLAGFLIFRFLDIVKPFPIRYLDRHIPGGFGVMVDDILAGVIANLILQIILLSL